MTHLISFEQHSTRRRGFASMDESKQREIARKGGRAAHTSGHAHQLTEEERRRGGQQSGGNFAHRPTLEVQAIGRKGGQARVAA